MPPSCRPMRASASRAAPIRRGSLPTASSRCCWRARSCCSPWRWLFTPAVIALLAPGFSKDPGRFALAVELTRITFPYLLLVTLVTLYGGILNALQRFAAAAAAPILLNLSMIATLAFAAFFPTAGHAAAWGVLHRRRSRSAAGGRRRLAARRAAGVPPAALGRGRSSAFFKALCAGDDRLGRDPDRAVRRHHHRELPGDRRAVRALLRRPAQPAADRRDRDRGRHRAAAGDGEPHRGRRRTRRAARAEPRDRADAAAVDPCLVAFLLVPDLIMRALFVPRRLHGGGCAGRRRDARGLRDRAAAVRAHAQRDRHVPRPRRYRHAGQGAACRGRGQCGAQNPVLWTATRRSASRSRPRSAPGSISRCWSGSRRART